MHIPTEIKYSTRNPLGIFAMFISLAYAAMMAGMIFGIEKLNGPYERLPIIYFLIIFPFVVLGIFTWLFIKYSSNFYGPADYRSDEAFVAMSGKEVKKKNEQEKAEIREQLNNDNLFVGSISDEERNKLKIKIARVQEAATEVERMTIAYLGRILNIDFRQNVRIQLNGYHAELDGVGDGVNGKYIIESKYLYRNPPKALMQQVSLRLRKLSFELDRALIPHRLFLFFVVQQISPDERSKIITYFKDNNPGLVVYVMDYHQLQEKIQTATE